MKYDFDVIIVGAGPAGAILSKILAEGGFRVALLEKKKREHIGYPWEITIEKKIFGRISLKAPDGGLSPESPEYYRFFAENRNDYLEMKSEDDAIYYFYHDKLNQYLISLALKRGVHFFDQHDVGELVLSEDHACGVRGERKILFATKQFTMTAKIIVDASGTNQVLCKQTPDDFMIRTPIRDEDWISAWQEVQVISPDKISACKKTLSISPGIAYLQVGKYHAYQIIHYRRDNTLNLVFGASRGKNIPTAHEQCKEFMEAYPFFKKQLYGGGKNLILRRSLGSMAGNGFVCLGDAACQVVPTTGSGVASGMYSADIAAKAITNAINSGDFSIKTLWDYNYGYQTKRGAILASYDIFRLFLQHLTHKEMKSIFDSHLVKDSNFISLYSSNKIVYNIQQIFENFSTFISHTELIPIGVQMVQAIRDTQKILKLYGEYPPAFNINHFHKWQQQVNSLFLRYYPSKKK
ncbi:MAG: NAD(P)/FAD-dependent oxidoreductase [Spirochaetales bacterium]|nr:NAD(P)/FAD-dependent oxidoreductase [Spirochaetales bacterium]